MRRYIALLLPIALHAQARPTVPAADYGKWESPGVALFSPNGRWFAYVVNRVDERSELRLRPTDRDTTWTFAQGSAPVFAATSQWLAYTVSPTPEEREKLERDKKPVRTSTVLVNLATGASTTIGQSTGQRFSADGRYLAVRLVPADVAKRDAADLLVRDLAAGTTQVIGNVATWQWSDRGALLAMTLETDGNVGNGVQLLDAGSGRLVTLASSTDRYRGLAWRKDAWDLAVLRSQASAAYRDSTHLVLAWRGLGAATPPLAFTLDPAQGAVDAAMRIAESRTPEWTRDGAGIVIGVRPREAKRDSAAAGPIKPSDVQVWHAKDVRPIPMQKVQESRDARRTLPAVWWLADGKVVRAGSNLDDDIAVAERGAVAIESSAGRYAWGAMFGRPRRDVTAIDLRTGERHTLADSVRFLGGMSPTGARYAFFANGAWRVANTTTGASLDVSGRSGGAFQDRDTDTPTDEFGPYGLAGWSVDERWIYVYDQYDIWRLAADGSVATRLTDGRGQRQVSRVAAVEPFEGGGFPGRSGPIDTARPVMLRVTGEWSKQSGYARLLADGRVESLGMQAAAHARIVRADSVDAYAFTRERFDTPANWYLARAGVARTKGRPPLADFATAARASDLNAFQSGYAWGKGELVEFTSDSGRKLQGALYYPANYDPAKKYPMIVNTYELLSQQVHNYLPPSERTYYNRTAWTQAGYFVFTPDIVFRWGDPGKSYLECLVPAVRAVIAMGVVDSAHIGLVGHSWGGYEAAYAPTQTTLFATSIAGAPITNFLSFPGAFHWSPGMPEFDHWETGQGRMVKPPWEDLAGHLRNSPAASVDKLQRPMLMVFGDADGTVDWHQGVEFYNFARRAGKQDFVMLVYPGEDHGLRKKENQVDYHRRILQWFGHWLKGEPAPDWITRGTTWGERKSMLEAADGKR